MPLDHGCRLDQHHGIEDLRPNPVKPNPEKSVRGEEPNPTWVLPTQDAHLMPQANQLELQGGVAAKPEGEDGNDSGQNRNHACDRTAVPPKALDSRQFAVLSMHRLPRSSISQSQRAESQNQSAGSNLGRAITRPFDGNSAGAHPIAPGIEQAAARGGYPY